MLPFSPPRIDDKIIAEVTDTLKSGWITTGPKTKLFEKRLTEYCGNKTTLCLSSATAGLETALQWFGVTEGDEVIVPVYTYCATANVVVRCRAKVVFVDCNSDDFNINISAIEKAITSKTKVIMPVDFAGLPCDYDAINKLVKAPEILEEFTPQTTEQKTLGRILVLSDSAHSVGGSYKGNKTGSLTDISVLSFHAVKNLSTAEGGAMCLNLPKPFDNEQIYIELCAKTLHGQNKDALAKTQKGNWKYDIIEAGYKCNMTDIQAAMGLVELERYENDTLVKRKQITDEYSAELGKYDWAQIPIFEDESRKSSYHLYPLRIKGITEEQRDAIIQKIFNEDISVNVHFQPLSNFTVYKKMGYKTENYPVAYDNYSREITLPLYYNLTKQNIQDVLQAVIQSVNKVLND